MEFGTILERWFCGFCGFVLICCMCVGCRILDDAACIRHTFCSLFCSSFAERRSVAFKAICITRYTQCRSFDLPNVFPDCIAHMLAHTHWVYLYYIHNCTFMYVQLNTHTHTYACSHTHSRTPQLLSYKYVRMNKLFVAVRNGLRFVIFWTENACGMDPGKLTKFYT